jgi:hypothetical protein
MLVVHCAAGICCLLNCIGAQPSFKFLVLVWVFTVLARYSKKLEGDMVHSSSSVELVNSLTYKSTYGTAAGRFNVTVAHASVCIK